MNLEDAKLEAATYSAKYDHLCRLLSPDRAPDAFDAERRHTSLLHALQVLADEQSEFFSSLHADPTMLEHIACWAFWVYGTSELTDESAARLNQRCEEAVAAKDYPLLILRMREMWSMGGGQLAANVDQVFLHGEQPDYATVGRTGWGLCRVLTTPDADEISRVLFLHFRKAADAKLIRFQRTFGGYRIKGIHTIDGMLAYITERGGEDVLLRGWEPYINHQGSEHFPE